MLTVERKNKVVSVHEFADVILNETTNQYTLYANKSYEINDILTFFTAGEIFTEPNSQTIQTGSHKHITLVPRFLQYIRHSCEPNVFFNTSKMKLICVKPISAGEELSFFYPSSEWKMSQPLICNCGSPNCLDIIQGAAFLDNDSLNKYDFTDYIKQHVISRNNKVLNQ